MKTLQALLLSCVVFVPQLHSHSISANLGTSIPLTDVDVTGIGGGKEKAGSAGLSIGGQYLYNLRKDIGIGLDINFASSGDKESSTFLTGANSTLSSKTTSVLAVGKKNFLEDKKVSPYVLVGLGFGINNLTIDAKPTTGFVWSNTGTAEERNLADSTKTTFAGALALGLDIAITEALFVGGEARYMFTSSATYEPSPAIKAAYPQLSGVEGSINRMNLTVALGYKF